MSLRIARIETWALDVVERVKEGKRVEDSRVELKREWPDDQKAARRIAAHSNASFGSDVLWIIGVDESSGVQGIEAEDLANWWPSVCSHFDGIPPALTDLVISVDGRSLVCLLLDTRRPPYVIKNPVFGSPGGGAVAFEVPWREGTSVRTAARNDLIRLLVPTITQPEIDVLGGSGSLSVKTESFPGDKQLGFWLRLSIPIYLFPRVAEAIVIPFYKCEATLSDRGSSNIIDDFGLTMYCPHSFHSQGITSDSLTIERTSNELIAQGPGKCTIDLSVVLQDNYEWLGSEQLTLRVTLHVIDSELPTEILVTLNQKEAVGDSIRAWEIEGDS